MPVSNIILEGFRQKIRTYLVGTEGHIQYVIPTPPRVVTVQYMVSSFRILGVTSANHNLFYIKNASSAVLAAVRRLIVEVDSTAALSSLSPSIFAYKIDAGASLPTGGTACTKHKLDSTLTSDANVTALGAASADGTANAITWTAPAGTPGWRQMIDRQQTAAGFIWHAESSLIPLLCDTDPIILRNTEALAVQCNIASLATNHYVIKAFIEEFTLP